MVTQPFFKRLELVEFRKSASQVSLGIIGLGAFGRLMAEHLAPHLTVLAHDPHPPEIVPAGVTMVPLREACRCDLVVIAVPLAALAHVCREMAPLLMPGTLVVDVCSTKVEASAAMRAELPPYVDLVASHPMFGPQSILAGTRGLKLVLCPLRGRRAGRLAAFLRKHFGLRILIATPDEHDREAAFTQGLTHLIAHALLRMDELPGRITTRSFDLLKQAVDMVRHDAPGVRQAIESNPYAAHARGLFLAELDAIRGELGGGPACK